MFLDKQAAWSHGRRYWCVHDQPGLCCQVLSAICGDWRSRFVQYIILTRLTLQVEVELLWGARTQEVNINFRFGGGPMKKEKRASKVFSAALRPAFAFCLFLSQLASPRSSVFTQDPFLLALGIMFILAGVLLWISASRYLSQATRAEEIATSGPFKYVRHPVYLSMYILSIGLGLIFFTWLWFVVLIAFFPLWYLECRGEEKEMIELHGEEYVDYQARTGMLLPKLV